MNRGSMLIRLFLQCSSFQFTQGNAKICFYSIAFPGDFRNDGNNKFFGDGNIIGKTLKVDNARRIMLSRAYLKIYQSANVSFGFEWLANFKIYGDQVTNGCRVGGSNAVKELLLKQILMQMSLPSIKTIWLCADKTKRSRCKDVHLPDEPLENVL